MKNVQSRICDCFLDLGSCYCEVTPPSVIHELKILPEYFNAVRSGKKRFEIRRDDGFNIGDTLKLMEFKNDQLTGRTQNVAIQYVLKNCPEYGLKQGYVILSIKKLKK